MQLFGKKGPPSSVAGMDFRRAAGGVFQSITALCPFKNRMPRLLDVCIAQKSQLFGHSRLPISHGAVHDNGLDVIWKSSSNGPCACNYEPWEYDSRHTHRGA